ncbi:MAG TPA: SPASM domain-containing protein [Burkholderiaceae bacterium]|nr:SPASM domain-containing protein [Burkholderiaceae bacterium]
MKIEITATCNYECSFCVKSLRNDSGHMDRALYSRLIREMRDAGVEELGVFYIGESFTCKWLPDAIREAKEVGFPYVFLTTNGSAATPQRVRECMDAGLDSLKFSLNFDSAAQLAEVAKVSPTFWRKAIEHLKAARRVRDEGGYKCGLYASSIAFDGAQGERMRGVIDEIRPYVDEAYWLPLYGMSGASAAAGWKPKPGNPGRLDNMREPLPCWAVFTEGHITHDGKLAACCFGDGLDGGLVMGDLTKQTFMQAWNSREFRALRAAHLAKDVRGTACEHCAAA